MTLPRKGSRLTLLALTIALALLAPAAANAAYTPVRGTDFFAPTSVWNAPLASKARLSDKSSTYVNTLVSSVATAGAYINTKQYSVPVNVVPADQPTVHVTVDTGNRTLQPLVDAVPIPADAKPADGTDGYMVVWQPSTQTMWEFWRAYKDSAGNWHTIYGGKMTNVDTNPGYFGNLLGASATGLPLMGGLMTLQEEADGVFNHALALSVPHPKAGTFVFPAQRTDGDNVSSSAIPEGTRFRLPASLNIDALNLPRQTKMMARAAQKYGIIVRDKAGSVTFKAEDPGLFQAKYGMDPYPDYFFG